MVKDSLWSIFNKLSIEAASLIESVEGNEDDVYQPLFEEDLEGEGVLNNLQPISKMHVEKAEVA